MTFDPKPARPRLIARDLPIGDYRLLAEFRHVLAKFLAFSEAAARRAGLSPRQHQALLAIRGHPGADDVTVGYLSERLGIRPHSAVGLVDRLAASGYLARRVDRKDGRRIRLALTARGRRTLAGLSTVHREELRRITALLEPVLAELGMPAEPARAARKRAHGRGR